jgi:hypothetical protein
MLLLFRPMRRAPLELVTLNLGLVNEPIAADLLGAEHAPANERDDGAVRLKAETLGGLVRGEHGGFSICEYDNNTIPRSQDIDNTDYRGNMFLQGSDDGERGKAMTTHSIRITGTSGDFYYTVKQWVPVSRELEKGCFPSARDVSEILADFRAAGITIDLISSGARGCSREYYDELKAIGAELGIEVVFNNG